jgi:glycosyltransferase involved in cell wall biosynthesis
MKVAVVNNCVPFLAGGAEHLAEALTSKLQEYGHSALLVRVPFCWEPPARILECMLACRLMRITNVDRVIALKFPVYYIPHPDKVLWLLHQFRQVYDMADTPFGFPRTPEAERIRDAIVAADNTHLRAVRRIYTNSQTTTDRLMRFNGIESEVLLPPLLTDSHFSCREYGDYIFYPSRLSDAKRQHLVVESMRYVRSGVKLVVAGNPDSPQELARIQKVIGEHRLEMRVQLLPRFIQEEEKAALFADALACAYTPYDEDSYGYVTLEAYASRKAVVTCSDAGGVLTVVRDGSTGLVVQPEAKAIAAAFDRLYADKAAARTMGEAGQDLVATLGISWDNVIRRLTE